MSAHAGAPVVGGPGRRHGEGHRDAVRTFLSDGEWTPARRVIAAVGPLMNPGVALRAFGPAQRLAAAGVARDDIVRRAQGEMVRSVLSSMVRNGKLEVRGPSHERRVGRAADNPDGQLRYEYRYEEDGVEVRLPGAKEPVVTLPVVAQWLERSASWAAGAVSDPDAPPVLMRGSLRLVRVADLPLWAAYSARSKQFYGRLREVYGDVVLRWMPFNWDTDALFNFATEQWERGDDGEMITKRAGEVRGTPPVVSGEKVLPLAGLGFGPSRSESAEDAVEGVVVTDDGDAYESVEQPVEQSVEQPA